MLGACSGGTESKEAADTAMEDKPVVRLASVTSRDVDQIEEYTATVEAEAKNNIAPTSPGRIDRIFVEVGIHMPSSSPSPFFHYYFLCYGDGDQYYDINFDFTAVERSEH